MVCRGWPASEFSYVARNIRVAGGRREHLWSKVSCATCKLHALPHSKSMKKCESVVLQRKMREPMRIIPERLDYMVISRLRAGRQDFPITASCFSHLVTRTKYLAGSTSSWGCCRDENGSPRACPVCPAGRAVAHGSVVSQRLQDALDQQVARSDDRRHRRCGRSQRQARIDEARLRRWTFRFRCGHPRPKSKVGHHGLTRHRKADGRAHGSALLAKDRPEALQGQASCSRRNSFLIGLQKRAN